MPTLPPDLLDENLLSQLAERGQAFYDEKLKALLEPEHNNQYVAIDVETGDYAVARSTSDAMRTMHQRRPDGRLFLRKVGAAPEPELAARLFMGGATTGPERK